MISIILAQTLAICQTYPEIQEFPLNQKTVQILQNPISMTEFSLPLKDVKAVNPKKARQIFEKANYFWFKEGRYDKVLSLYIEALKYDPTDPVMLYQLAVVLRAFEQFEQAKEVLALAEQHQNRLSEKGRQRFAKEKSRLLKRFSYIPLPIPASEINLDKLIADNPSYKPWFEIAIAAEKRRMFLLAAEAYDRSLPFSDFETIRDAEWARRDNESDQWLLKFLRH